MGHKTTNAWARWAMLPMHITAESGISKRPKRRASCKKWGGKERGEPFWALLHRDRALSVGLVQLVVGKRK